MPNVLDLIYSVALLAATPWLLWRRWILKKPVAGLGVKLTGNVARLTGNQRRVWFHAVSVGEVLQLQSLIAEYVRRHPGDAVVISTTTGTGYEVARQKFPDRHVIYWPLDFSWAVQRSLALIQPSLIVLVELEIWPNFLSAARQQNVPVVVINGRISSRSYQGYRRWKFLLSPVFRSLSQVAVQTEEYAERFRELGVPAAQVHVTGNIKYDRVESDRRNPRTQALREFFRIAADDIVFIAGSTQETEEAAALQCYQQLKDEFPQLRLLLVPRHRERFEDVARLVQQSHLPLLRRSRPEQTVERPVLLLDTLGELGACWGLADLAFVGGSLTRRGGQNMLEPAAYAAAVMFGPNTANFRDIVHELLSREAAVVVHDAQELAATLRIMLINDAERTRLGIAARSFVLTQQGATLRTLDLLEQQLPAVPQSRAA